MFRTKVVEKIEIGILCAVMFSESRAVYEIMWRNIVEPGRLQTTI